MRNWIVLGIVFVFIMVGFLIYLEIDTRRFIENLPQPPPDVQQRGSISDLRSVSPSGDRKEQTELVEIVEDISLSPSDRQDSSGDFVEDDVDTRLGNSDGSDPWAEHDENQVSSELEELFLRYRVLDEKRRAVVKVLEPMHEEHVSIIDRHHEISHALSLGQDAATQQALNEERATLLAREKVLQPRIFEVQRKKEVVIEALESLVWEYGFSSWKEFRATYQADYKAWADAR